MQPTFICSACWRLQLYDSGKSTMALVFLRAIVAVRARAIRLVAGFLMGMRCSRSAHLLVSHASPPQFGFLRLNLSP